MIYQKSYGKLSQTAGVRSEFWSTEVKHELDSQDWSVFNISENINLPMWQSFLPNLPPDPYVECRWKRMSWLEVLENGDVQDMGLCSMAQSSRYNDADTMANKKRFYPSLERAFLDRADVQAFVRSWAKLWELKPQEPILMQITGVKGYGCIDPLQGQGIHADGCKALSLVVLSRKNVCSSTNHLYHDKAGKQPIADIDLNPGDVLRLRIAGKLLTIHWRSQHSFYHFLTKRFSKKISLPKFTA